MRKSKKKTPALHAVGYARVSTREQADTGHSLEAQEEKIRAYAVAHDIKLDDVIIDDGKSAKDLDRPGARRLMRMVKKREVDCVVIAKLDRLTRSVRDLGELIDLFEEHGVEFASVADHIDTSTASGRLVLNVMGSVAQWERETIGERTSEVLTRMRKQGKRVSHIATFGYRLNKDGEQVEDATEQEAITEMKRLRRRRGLSYNAIGRILAEKGYFGRNGRPVTAKTVRAVLNR